MWSKMLKIYFYVMIIVLLLLEIIFVSSGYSFTLSLEMIFLLNAPFYWRLLTT
jgi:hypothetical protein